MYVVLDKEKPSIYSIRGLNLAAGRLTTVHLTNCSFSVVAVVKVLPTVPACVDRRQLYIT
jgi:hypothetical protein